MNIEIHEYISFLATVVIFFFVLLWLLDPSLFKGWIVAAWRRITNRE